MKKARTTSARATAKKKPSPSSAVSHRAPPKPVAPSAPVAETVEAAPKKLPRGLGSLGRKSLERAEIVSSLVLIPATRPNLEPLITKKSTLPARRISEANEQNESALVSSLKDELHALLALLDEAPPSQ